MIILFPIHSNKLDFNFNERKEIRFDNWTKDKQWFTQDDDVTNAFPTIRITKTNADKTQITDLHILSSRNDKTVITHTTFNTKNKITQFFRCYDYDTHASKNYQPKSQNCDIMTNYQYHKDGSMSQFRIDKIGRDKVLGTADDIVQSKSQTFYNKNGKPKKVLTFQCNKKQCTQDDFQANSILSACTYYDYYANESIVVETNVIASSKKLEENPLCKTKPKLDPTTNLKINLSKYNNRLNHVPSGRGENYFKVTYKNNKAVVGKRHYQIYDKDDNVIFRATYYENGADDIWNTTDDSLLQYTKFQYNQIAGKKLVDKIYTLSRNANIAQQIEDGTWKYHFQDKVAITINDKPNHYIVYSYDSKGREKKVVFYKIANTKDQKEKVEGYILYKYQ